MSVASLARRLLDSSAPLVAGIAVALAWANLGPSSYLAFVRSPWIHDPPLLHGRAISVHFLVNDVFMVLFFGLAAREITLAVLPGGALHPLRRAVNPVLASLGGVIGPALIYLALVHGLFRDAPRHAVLMQGWAVPTATDIALVWLLGRFVFGAAHPIVKFLLVLAIVDDALGLAIIAVFFPEAGHGSLSPQALAIGGGLAVAAVLRASRVQSWLAYLILAGGPVWLGLLATPVHPSLALVPVVPFMAPRRGEGGADQALTRFQHRVSPVVESGLFFFGLANAGVRIEQAGFLTWVVLVSLVLGKTLGISAFALTSERALGLSLPKGVTRGHVLASSFLASVGLTVAIFVAGEALPDRGPYQSAAKLGAVLSLSVVAVAPILRAWVQPRRHPPADGSA